jgi:integration host factor subunit alpha
MTDKIKTTTKQTLSDSLVKKIGISNSHAKEIVDIFFKTISQGLKEDGVVKISRFGTFKILNKKERLGRNPKNLEDAIIKPRKVATFKTSEIIRNTLNKSVKN